MKRLTFALLIPGMLLAQKADLTDAQKEYFEARIRPVLAQQCFICHTNTKAGGLRLDSREEMMKGGDSGAVVVPGDPEKSLLIASIRHSGLVRMPKAAAKLTDAQIADFTTWVKDGAYWPAAVNMTMNVSQDQKKFWAYQPLKSGPVPAVKDAAWASNDIDKFILARLEKDNLKPAPVTDRRTLIKRVTYDLTGLPATFEEVKAFENDKSPNAFEKVVDRLLASPRYGEMWARHWMDVVRYGEDDYRVAKQPDRVEKYPFAYLYRDWLINAFNDDVPFNTFVKAQLAADLMDEKDRGKMIPALGMHGTGVWSFQDNPAPIERADEWHDKIDVTTKAFLGLTVGCARCHNHKYDPIPTKDYYRIASVFASSKFQPYPQVPKAVSDKYEAMKKELEEKEKGQKKFLEQASDLFAQSLMMQTREYMLAAWRVGTVKRATVQSIAEDGKLDTEILDKWVRFLKKGQNNYPYLAAWQQMVAKGGTEDDAKKLAGEFYTKIASVNKDYQKLAEENEAQLAKYKDEKEEFDPLPNGIKRKLNRHQVELKSLSREDTYLWKDLFDQDLPDNPGNPNAEDKKKPGLFKLTDWALEKRLSPELTAHVARLKADIEAFKKEMGPEPPFVYGIAEAEQPTNLKVFVRGNVYNFGEDAPRGFMTIFADNEPKNFEKGSGRLELAEEILKQPITSRVIVNRIWRWHMGSGFVETPNNFGIAGDRPSNPELLDFLATKFQEGGMSWKKLHKMILLSKTYQLSASTVEANLEKDPGNRLYWRGNRRRLDAEGVWDSLLTASATLDTSKVGGPSEEVGSLKMTRRGVYGRTSRMYPSDFLAIFDAPAATISNDFRYTTNVPQQRLFFLNSEFVRKSAELLAARVKSAGDSDAQVKKAFELVYQRAPSPAELRFVAEFLKTAEAEAAAVPTAAPAKTAPAAAPSMGGVIAKPEPTMMAQALPPAMPESKPAEAKAADGKDTVAVRPSPLESLCWALLSSNEFLYLN